MPPENRLYDASIRAMGEGNIVDVVHRESALLARRAITGLPRLGHVEVRGQGVRIDGRFHGPSGSAGDNAATESVFALLQHNVLNR